MGTTNQRSFGVRSFAWVAVLGLMPRVLVAAPDIALQMVVDVAVPTVGQPVQFTVTASNIGADAATGVQVTDQLPAELAIPAGTAAFPSTGTFDAATGVWAIGSMAAGASATLVIPAVVAVANQPPCSVNVARLTSTVDADSSNNRASAAVRRSATDRCVDLYVFVDVQYIPSCATSNSVSNVVRVRNFGPDPATNVYTDLSQNPAVTPNLRLTSPGGKAGVSCAGTRCSIAAMAAGTYIDLQAVSASFKNDVQLAPTLSASVSGDGTDFATANNQSSVTDVFPAVSAKCEEIKIPTSVGGCFIATAAYGSPLEPHVMALREFRDRYLQRSALGRAFIRFYYRHSPPVAALIAEHEWLRAIVRMLLAPVVLIVEFPLRGAAVLLLALALFFGVRLRTRSAEQESDQGSYPCADCRERQATATDTTNRRSRLALILLAGALLVMLPRLLVAAPAMPSEVSVETAVAMLEKPLRPTVVAHSASDGTVARPQAAEQPRPPVRPLRLTLTQAEMRAIVARYQNDRGGVMNRPLDEVVVTAPVELLPMRDITQDVWGGLAAPLWALLHPTQAWRIFLPIPQR